MAPRLALMNPTRTYSGAKGFCDALKSKKWTAYPNKWLWFHRLTAMRQGRQSHSYVDDS
jgi:hypothetical protein